MVHGRGEALIGNALREFLGDHHRTVLAPGTADRDRQLGLPFGDVAEQAPHDLPRACLRQIGGEENIVRPGDRADLPDDVFLQFVAEILGPRGAVLERDERGDRLSFQFMRTADDRRFRDGRMIDERALDFHRPQAVPGDVDDVVDAAEEPEAAVGVALGAVARDVDAGSPLVPVLLHVAIRIAVDAAEHRGPRTRQREQPAADVNSVARLRQDLGGDAGERPRGGSRLERRHARKRRDHDGARFGLPPGVDDGTSVGADEVVVPHPRFGVDWLANAA